MLFPGLLATHRHDGRPGPIRFVLPLPHPEPRMTTSNSLPPFHLAFPVRDLAEARAFYGDLLGCPEGRRSAEWVDFNFYGHQMLAHRRSEERRVGQEWGNP